MSNDAADRGLMDAEKADLYWKLAERAWNRMQSRRAMEWRTLIGIWSAFGGGAAVVIAAPSWSPGLLLSIAASALAILIVALSCIYWLPYLNRELQRENKTSYFFESYIHRIVGTRPPEHLRPGSHLPNAVDPGGPSADWPCAFDEDPNKVGGSINSAERVLSKRLHIVQKVQLAMTVVFAMIFVAAFFSKYLYHAAAGEGKARVTIEGRDLRFESLSKMELNTKDATINP